MTWYEWKKEELERELIKKGFGLMPTPLLKYGEKFSFNVLDNIMDISILLGHAPDETREKLKDALKFNQAGWFMTGIWVGLNLEKDKVMKELTGEEAAAKHGSKRWVE